MTKLPSLPCPIPVLALMCVLLLHAVPRPTLSSRATLRDGVSFAGAGNTVHQLLKDHNLPGGLLPRNVESYTFNKSTGLLEAHLSSPCYTAYRDNELVLLAQAHFDNVVHGNLSKGALRDVKGLSLELSIIWRPVKGILVQDQVIQFDIEWFGLDYKNLSRSLFKESPECERQPPPR